MGEYEQDALASRIVITLPDGRKLHNFYYGSGHSLNIVLHSLPITDFSRDVCTEKPAACRAH